MDWEDIRIWPVLAGLGLFLFGMYMLEEALKALSGRAFKLFLRKHTAHRVKAVAAGALVTAVLQSSSMVVLLVMSFAGAGIIGLSNGIGMIMGANLGTTMTGWLISLLGFKLNIETLILPFLAVGGMGIIFLKSERLAHFSKLLMGFSFMFLGLGYMKNGFAEFAAAADLTVLQGRHPVLFLLFGLLLTAAIQSSSASMMIVLSSLAAGIITLDQAVYMVIGADLGTTITALIGTAGANSLKKKVGWSQFLFNAFNACLGIALMGVYLHLIQRVAGVQDPLIAVVFFHSLLNLGGILCVLPLLGHFTRLINRVITVREVRLAQKIMLATPQESVAALVALREEAVCFLSKAVAVSRSFFGSAPGKPSLRSMEGYFSLKNYEAEIVGFYIRLQQMPLTETEVHQLNSIVDAIRSAALAAKGIKDVKHNLDELAGATTQAYYDFYLKIHANQTAFYAEIEALIQNLNVLELPELEKLNDLQRTYHQHETQEVYRFYDSDGQPEVAIPSMLNLIRELNLSNEMLLRGLGDLLRPYRVQGGHAV